MTARYQARVSDELIEAWDVSLLPHGLRIVEIGLPHPAESWRMVIFDDDSAPGMTHDQLVTLLFQGNADGTVIITSRELQA